MSYYKVMEQCSLSKLTQYYQGDGNIPWNVLVQSCGAVFVN
jgi:hypothetical protein